MKSSVLLLALAVLAPSQTIAEIANKSVRIGVLTDMSGPYTDNNGAGAVLAARMAVEDFGGKVAGRPVDVVYADHQNRADVGLGIARRWYELEGVDTITEIGNSSVALAVQQLSRDKNKVLLATGAGTPELTGKACSPVGVQWAYDNYSVANIATVPLVKKGLKSWYFLTADYAFGHTLETEASKAIEANGGTVLGVARHPLASSDFASYLLRAQSSKAQVIALANSGADMANTLKQANEFGITQGGQALVALLVTLPDIHALGLESTKGLIFADSFYWDATEATRAWSNASWADLMARHRPAFRLQSMAPLRTI